MKKNRLKKKQTKKHTAKQIDRKTNTAKQIDRKTNTAKHVDRKTKLKARQVYTHRRITACMLAVFDVANLVNYLSEVLP